MKVRIKGNFIRYRLSKSEVEDLSLTGIVKETTCLGVNNFFTYSLVSKDGIENLEANFMDGNLIIFLPKENAQNWFTNSKVGYRSTVKIDEKNILVLLVEKDFQCLDETEEDQSNNYPNPIAKE